MLELTRPFFTRSPNEICNDLSRPEFTALGTFLTKVVFNTNGDEILTYESDLAAALSALDIRNKIKPLLQKFEAQLATGKQLLDSDFSQLLLTDMETAKTLSLLRGRLISDTCVRKDLPSPDTIETTTVPHFLEDIDVFRKAIGGAIGFDQWFALKHREQGLINKLERQIRALFTVLNASILTVLQASTKRTMACDHSGNFHYVSEIADRLGNPSHPHDIYIHATDDLIWRGFELSSVADLIAEHFDENSTPDPDTIKRFVDHAVYWIESDLDEHHYEDAREEIRNLKGFEATLAEFAKTYLDLTSRKPAGYKKSIEEQFTRLADELAKWNASQTIVSYLKDESTIIVHDTEVTRLSILDVINAEIDRLVDQIAANGAAMTAPLDWETEKSRLKSRGVCLSIYGGYAQTFPNHEIFWSAATPEDPLALKQNGPYPTLETLVPHVERFLAASQDS